LEVYINKVILPFYNHILESIQAYYAGLYKAAIITLIPCIEGVIRNIGGYVGKPSQDIINRKEILDILKKVEIQEIRNNFLNDYDWFPEDEVISLLDNFDERIQMIESLRYFIEKSMYHDTRSENYSPSSNILNRHEIIHGLIVDFDSPINYLKLIVLLNALATISIIAGDPGRCSLPIINPEAKVLESH